MKTRFTLLLALFLGTCVIAKAQNFEVPQNYVLKDKADYPKYQVDVLKAIDWLQQTSWAGPSDKRKEVNGFLVAWITGSPDVSIEINSSVTKLADVNGELLIMYMAGYTKYALENPSNKDKNKPRVAGFRAVLAKYQNDKVFKKDKELEKLIKIDQDGKLDDWVLKAFS